MCRTAARAKVREPARPSTDMTHLVCMIGRAWMPLVGGSTVPFGRNTEVCRSVTIDFLYQATAKGVVIGAPDLDAVRSAFAAA